MYSFQDTKVCQNVGITKREVSPVHLSSTLKLEFKKELLVQIYHD